MRYGLLAAAVMAVLAPSGPVRAADLPPVVVQIAAPGKLLDDIRAMAKAVGGDAAVAKFNASLKEKFGENGFDSIDLNRAPVFGIYYRENAAEGEDAYGVGITSVNDEKAFIKLLEKGEAEITPIAGKKGRYQIKSPDEKPAILQFRDGFLYAGFGMSDAEFDLSKFPTYEKLASPGDQSIASARVYIDRFPASAQKKMATSIDEAIAKVTNMPLPPDAKEGMKKATEKLGAAAKYYLGQMKDMSEGVFRIVFDPATSEAALEIGIVGKPGSSLAKDIAARPQSTNRFVGLMGKETTAGILFGLPLSNTDIREGLALAFEGAGKEGLNTVPPPAAATMDELVKGIARTLRSGELDLGVAVNGPNKDGHFGIVLGVSFDNPAALEKELRAMYKDSPKEVKAFLKLDAAKVGEQSVHVARVGPLLPPEAQAIFGEEAELAFAFAPKGVYLVFGVDPLTTMKQAVGTTPQPARGFDILVNPNRLEKLVSSIGGPPTGAKVADSIGVENKLFSAFFTSVEGGSELKIRVGLNLKLIPRAIFMNVPESALPSQ